MAKAIKETPIIQGADAKRFFEQKKVNHKKVTDEKMIRRMQANYDKLRTLLHNPSDE